MALWLLAVARAGDSSAKLPGTTISRWAMELSAPATLRRR